MSTHETASDSAPTYNCKTVQEIIMFGSVQAIKSTYVENGQML